MTLPHRRRCVVLACLLWLPLAQGCSYFQAKEPLGEPVGLVAVLPLRRAERVENDRVAPGAERVITAHVYGVMAQSSQWDYVPDLGVGRALPKLPREEDIVAQAVLLGKAVHASAVICGTVSRYTEREGSEYGARQPASVGVQLQLVSTATGKVLWNGSFDETQKPLSENLFNWWQFWRAGVRWFTAEELSRLGVERMLEDLRRHL